MPADRSATPRRLLPLLAAGMLALAACGGTPAPQQTRASSEQADVAPAASAQPAPSPRGVDWSSREFAGEAWIGCDADAGDDDAAMTRLPGLDHASMRTMLAPCVETGVLRLRYRGKIDDGFVALMERVVDVASATGIALRVLELDSSGGLIEQAILAGDLIAESDWTVWVQQGASCHSACVPVLAAGDMRVVAGDVGIHRMMRVGSSAATRQELDRELQAVNQELGSYLQRNGVASAVADLMMSVPNRRLRLLTPEELDRYGLVGPNAAEDDLDRIRLARRCGEDFVRRRDAFHHDYENECLQAGGIAAANACALALRGRHGFPDAACQQDSPFAELDKLARQ